MRIQTENHRSELNNDLVFHFKNRKSQHQTVQTRKAQSASMSSALPALACGGAVAAAAVTAQRAGCGGSGWWNSWIQCAQFYEILSWLQLYSWIGIWINLEFAWPWAFEHRNLNDRFMIYLHTRWGRQSRTSTLPTSVVQVKELSSACHREDCFRCFCYGFSTSIQFMYSFLLAVLALFVGQLHYATCTGSVQPICWPLPGRRHPDSKRWKTR